MPRPARRFARILLPLLILAAALVVAAYLRATRPEVAAEPARERSWPVAVVEAEVAPARPLYHLDGELVAGRVAALRPRVGGTLVMVADALRDGGAVPRGMLLARVDPFDYEAAVTEREADLREARARVQELEVELEAERTQVGRDREQLELARRDLRRKETLFGQGAIPQKTLDDARLLASQREQALTARQQAVSRLEAKLEQARAGVARAESALSRARRDLADTELRAPFDAFLEEVEAAEGREVSQNDRLARLIAAREMEVRFHMPDRIYGRLLGDALAGRAIRVHWRAGGGEQSFDATVSRIDSRIRGASGGVDVFARLTGLGLDSPLRPGAFVSVEVPGRRYADVVRLPERALHDGPAVYVVAEGRLQRRDVEVVARAGGDVLVRGDLADGERVVLTRFPEIAEGLKVSVR